MTFISIGFHFIDLKPCEKTVRTLFKFFNSQICFWWHGLRSIISITGKQYLYHLWIEKGAIEKYWKITTPEWSLVECQTKFPPMNCIYHLFWPFISFYSGKYRLILVKPYQNHKHVILQWANHVKGNQILLTNLLRLQQKCLLFF